MTTPRWIGLEGAANARDLGGLPTDDGRAVRPSRLLRTDNLQGLTPADVATLVDEVGLRTVVDLRTEFEVTKEGPAPLARHPQVAHHHFSVMPEAGFATDVAADALLTRRERRLARFPSNAMVAHYLGYLDDRPESVVGALRAIAASGGAALVHCAAGKDRTGVVVGLALSVAGVRREAIVADYAASGERIEAIIARLRASPTYAADIDKRPSAYHTPMAETMTIWLEQVDLQYGGPLPYLESHGFAAEDVARLHTHLLD